MSIILIIVLAMNIKAQSDGFFRYHEIRGDRLDEKGMLLLPDVHGLECNYSAVNAPLGHGLLLLSLLGILYLVNRKQ